MKVRNRSAMAAGGLAMCAAAGIAGGGFSIDVNGAVLVPGDAPVAGDVTIDPAAQLGAPPAIGNGFFGHYPGNSPTSATGLDAWIDAGLGGPDFRARVDMTLAGGVYDFGAFVVDPGVTLTFSGATTIRAAKDVRIEGRVEMTGASPGDLLAIRSAGTLDIVAHAGEASGIAADDDGAELRIHTIGDVTIAADAGAEAVLSAAGDRGKIRLTSYAPEQTATLATFTRARFRSGENSVVYVWGPATLDACGSEGDLEIHVREPVIYQCDPNDRCTDGDPRDDAAIVRGGTFEDGLGVFAGAGSVTLADGVIVEGHRCEVWATGYGGGLSHGALRVAEDTRIEVSHHVTLAASQDLEIAGGCVIRTTGDEPGGAVAIASRHLVSIADGTLVEFGGDTGGGSAGRRSLSIVGSTVAIRGTVRGAGPETYVGANADIVLSGDAILDGGDGALVLGARGAVVASGGNVTIDAGDVDIRCATGDLDLDVTRLDASTGKFAALSNGCVRLRGTYAAARDIHVLSLADVVNVAGATLTTDDVSGGISGFVRLATYGSPTTLILGGDVTSDGDDDDDDDGDDGGKAKGRTDPTPGDRVLINASGAELRTGDSDAQSGSILVQNQEAQGTMAKASIRVTRSTARRKGADVVTQLRGTITIPRRKLDLAGSGRVSAGTIEERLLLDGGRSSLRGRGGAVSLTLTRSSSSRIGFAIDVQEPASAGAAAAGESARVAFHRAGLHVRGTFRRPRVR